ncbi:MAG TPA: DUF3306 domain-containing protein [Burkholderiales bacterium]|nr:DUF3306 domain-containing protein [Burkholderiales bacterium]
MATEEKKEAFLDRWSRLKKEERELPVKDEKPVPDLPPVDRLTPESDFTGFMHPKVEDALRRVALKKLFSDPRFNVADPFEAYSGDWTGGEPIPEEMLAALNQAKRLLFDDNKEADGEKKEPEKTATPNSDEPGRKDA